MTMLNNNCLEGVKCPKCGNEERFRIQALIVCNVTDEGSEPTGDHEWDQTSHTLCPVCEFEDNLSAFSIAGEKVA
jgi:hypothetical protein